MVRRRRTTDRATYDLRISGASMQRFAAEIGFGLSRKAAVLRSAVIERSRGFYEVDTTIRLVGRLDDGVELTYNLSEPRNHSYVANGIVVRNCSEYMHLDNSACNLASINLLKYLDEDGTFDVDGYMHTIEVVFTAQDILVGRADYPTPAIADEPQVPPARPRLRQLGALLMALGHAYDSEGRAWAAGLTSLMTGHAYAVSARTASRLGPFEGYAANQEHMFACSDAPRRQLPDRQRFRGAVQAAHRRSGGVGERRPRRPGVRREQQSVFGFGADRHDRLDDGLRHHGHRARLGLVKIKKLVGGGTMSIVNQTIPRALRRLGYDNHQVGEIIDYIDVHKSILGAPHLAGRARVGVRLLDG